MTEVPIRIKVQSDDLPDDVEQEILDYHVQIRESPIGSM